MEFKLVYENGMYKMKDGDKVLLEHNNLDDFENSINHFRGLDLIKKNDFKYKFLMIQLEAIRDYREVEYLEDDIALLDKIKSSIEDENIRNMIEEKIEFKKKRIEAIRG